VLPGGAREFRDRNEAQTASPLAARLFEIDGVTGVFLGSDFISVTKSGGEWQHLKPALLGAIMEHYLSGAPAVTGAAQADGHSAEGDGGEDSEIVQTIKELLDTRVRPAVAQDGGDIVFHGYDGGIVYLHMRGACAGCPSSTATLRHGIENLLRHFIPEVQEVRAV
jgi:Fe-S cluster biogenesis protein NfuA